jgi:uncharacterized membrane protein
MPNPIKPTFKTEAMPLITIAVAIASSFYFYANFPERVPTHWNFQGEIDGWNTRGFGAFFLPILLIGMYLMFLAIPYIDPKKARYSEFLKVYHVFKAFIILLLFAIYLIASLNGLGYDISVDFWTPFLIGILFIVLGNYMGKIKPNWFMGIRTPWTLSSEEVWNKTHRFGGKVFILGGFLMIFEGIFPAWLRMPLFMGIMLIILAGTVGYSYYAYVKLKK